VCGRQKKRRPLHPPRPRSPAIYSLFKLARFTSSSSNLSGGDQAAALRAFVEFPKHRSWHHTGISVGGTWLIRW
jgi:hypothetical protein